MAIVKSTSNSWQSPIKVKLIAYTPEPERVIAAAGRSCYSKEPTDILMETMSENDRKKLIPTLVKMGHHSVIEHAVFTFAISGVSRVTTHQLVRHRIASYSQKSQRYVKEKNFDYVEPPKIQKNEEAHRIFTEAMKYLSDAYAKLVKLGIPKEDARYLLPNATQSHITVTMNARELLHFINLRMAPSAQWEIRILARLMLEEVRKVAPTVFENIPLEPIEIDKEEVVIQQE